MLDQPDTFSCKSRWEIASTEELLHLTEIQLKPIGWELSIEMNVLNGVVETTQTSTLFMNILLLHLLAINPFYAHKKQCYQIRVAVTFRYPHLIIYIYDFVEAKD